MHQVPLAYLTILNRMNDQVEFKGLGWTAIYLSLITASIGVLSSSIPRLVSTTKAQRKAPSTVNWFFYCSLSLFCSAFSILIGTFAFSSLDYDCLVGTYSQDDVCFSCRSYVNALCVECSDLNTCTRCELGFAADGRNCT